jgi:hypothetical protein
MDRFLPALLPVGGTVALRVGAQAVLPAGVRSTDRRTRGATELRPTFWISLGAVVPLMFGHLAQAGLWASFLVWRGTLTTHDDGFHFPLVGFVTPGYGGIVSAPGDRIFGASKAACGALALGWSTALVLAAAGRSADRGGA